MRYNQLMSELRRRRAAFPALLAASLALSILLPVAPWGHAYAWDQPQLQLRPQRELLSPGGPFKPSCDLVLNPTRLLQGKLQNTIRQQPAVMPVQLYIPPSTSFESSTPSRLPKLFWCKNRRYICQMLDLPPPSSFPSCAV